MGTLAALPIKYKYYEKEKIQINNKSNKINIMFIHIKGKVLLNTKDLDVDIDTISIKSGFVVIMTLKRIKQLDNIQTPITETEVLRDIIHYKYIISTSV